MGKIETYVCEEPGCGKQKSETNHWWAILETGPAPARAGTRTVEVRALHGRLRDGEKTYCGDEHAMAEVSRCLRRIARHGGK